MKKYKLSESEELTEQEIISIAESNLPDNWTHSAWKIVVNVKGVNVVVYDDVTPSRIAYEKDVVPNIYVD